MRNTIPIESIFGPTIQGEGPVMGMPTLFVRSGYCDYRCTWCDTMYAVDPSFKKNWTPMTHNQILQKLIDLAPPPILVSISGGNPALHDFSAFIHDAKTLGYTIAVETQGSIFREWFHEVDYLILSPKPPSSNMKIDLNTLARCILHNTHIKIVVFDDQDFSFAQEIHWRFPGIPFYLQVGNSQFDQSLVDKDLLLKRLNWLAQKVIEARMYNVFVLPQLHVLLWNNKKDV